MATFSLSDGVLRSLQQARNGTFDTSAVNRPPDSIPPPAFGAIEPGTQTERVRSPYTGQPVWEQVAFPSQYLEKSDRVEAEYFFPPATVVKCSQTRTIVKTAVAGRNGTVKELIAANDWDVSIEGVIADPSPDGYPYEEIERMRTIAQLPESVLITAELFNYLGISRLVFEGFEVEPLDGFPNCAAYRLRATSDEPVELELKRR